MFDYIGLELVIDELPDPGTDLEDELPSSDGSPMVRGGRTSNTPWEGPHKRILSGSEDPESTLSGSETQEARPGWPPDDMCADSTRYKGSFDDRDREGLRVVSPLFRKKVLKLQRDLEEAKAESRYLQTGRQSNNRYEPTAVYVDTRATL